MQGIFYSTTKRYLIRQSLIKNCDVEINEINKEIESKNKKQKGGKIINKIDEKEILYLLIPSNN